MFGSSRSRSGLALAIVIIAGMLCRGIREAPQFISKDVADALWAFAIYLGLRVCSPRPSIRIIASGAIAIAFGIGGKDLAQAFLEKRFVRGRKIDKDDEPAPL